MRPLSHRFVLIHRILVQERFGIFLIQMWNAPIQDFRGLHEAVLVCLGANNDYYELVAFLLVDVETAQAWSSIWCVASFDAVIALPWIFEQDV